MLVLSRKKEEVIIIGDDIKITIVDIKGGKVRIGVEAPVDVKVYRQEVYDRIQEEKAEKVEEGSTGFYVSGSGQFIFGPSMEFSGWFRIKEDQIINPEGDAIFYLEHDGHSKGKIFNMDGELQDFWLDNGRFFSFDGKLSFIENYKVKTLE